MKPIYPTLFSVFSLSPGEGKTLCVVGSQITLEEHSLNNEEPGTLPETPPNTQTESVLLDNPMEEEWVYMLEGELSFQLGDRVLTLLQGGYLLAPPGIPQSIKNEGDTVAKMLVIVSPSGLRE